MWLTAPDDPSPEITIDLGKVHAIDDLRIWNYNETGLVDRGIQTFDVFLAGRDLAFGDTPVLTGATLSPAPGDVVDFPHKNEECSGQTMMSAAAEPARPRTWTIDRGQARRSPHNKTYRRNNDTTHARYIR